MPYLQSSKKELEKRNIVRSPYANNSNSSENYQASKPAPALVMLSIKQWWPAIELYKLQYYSLEKHIKFVVVTA